MKKLKSGTRLDEKDRKACLDIYGPILSRCAGGRIIVPGYICPHCDSENPKTKCHKPSDMAEWSWVQKDELCL